MLLFIAATIGGLVVLALSADRLVSSSAGLARNLKVPTLLIGLTIVAFGTSTPEFFVSASAALSDKGALAVGNAIGSNIANIGMVLGLSALLRPMAVGAGLLRREVPMMMVVLLAAWWLLHDGLLSFVDGLLLLTGLLLLVGWMIFLGLRGGGNEAAPDHGGEQHYTNSMALLWITIAITLLLLSSKALVWGAIGIAQYFGVSELVIGLTIVAIGTSLPEAATSVSAALKGHNDIALGNIIGSNIFNTLGVIGIAGTLNPLSPLALEAAVQTRDMPVMIGMSLVMVLFVWLARRGAGGNIRRSHGALLLLAWGAYLGWLALVSLPGA